MININISYNGYSQAIKLSTTVKYKTKVFLVFLMKTDKCRNLNINITISIKHIVIDMAAILIMFDTISEFTDRLEWQLLRWSQIGSNSYVSN